MKTAPVLLVLLLPFFAAANATAADTIAPPYVAANAREPVAPLASGINLPKAPKLSAQAYLLYDYTSNQILLEHRGHERIEPASLTKLMTAYLTFSSIRQKKHSLHETVNPSPQAIHTQRAETRMFLRHNKNVSIEELLKGLIIVSANDAARVLAETVAGNEAAFAELMNKEALRLGMTDSHFVNATGLPNPLHYSSARDLALLTSAILTDFPEYFPLYSRLDYEYNNIKNYNRNRLLWLDPYVDGIKTGHTESAGYCLIATAKRDDHRLISVLLNTNSEHLRSTESQRLLNYGFQEFEIFYLYKKNEAISRLRLWKGTENTVKAGVRNGVTLTLPKGQRALLTATVESRQPLIAPVSDGQQLGALKLSLDGKPYLEFPLVALEAVPLVNIFSRGIDSIRLMFIK